MDMPDSAYCAIFVSLFGIATVTLVLRLYVRRFMTVRRFDIDDYLIILSWVSLLVMTILACELVSHNITRFIVAPLDDVMLNLRIFFVMPFVHVIVLWSVKFSLLAFYNRIFSQPQLKQWTFFTAIFLILTMIASFLTQFFYCLPIKTNFDPAVFQLVCGQSSKTANIVFCVLSCLTDAAVMVIPLWTLPKLRISLAKRLALICLFVLGSFAIVASIVRCVISVIDAVNLTKVLIWSSVEEVVVIVANVPILRPLFFGGKNFESGGTTSNHGATRGTRGYTTGGGTLHDVYEMAPDKMGNMVSVVTAGDQNYKKLPAHRSARAPAPTTQDTFSVLRTVEVMVHSEDTNAKQKKLEEDGSSSNSSLWMP